MARPSEHGMLINRTWMDGYRVLSVHPDHEIGGFVVVMDVDEDGDECVHFLPVIGVFHYEIDDPDGISHGLGLYTVACHTGTLEFWDMECPFEGDVLGFSRDNHAEALDEYRARARARLVELRSRSQAADQTADATFAPTPG